MNDLQESTLLIKDKLGETYYLQTSKGQPDKQAKTLYHLIMGTSRLCENAHRTQHGKG